MEKTARVKIIGAGASGISAAAKLIESGFENVTIIEASERIGGRIESVSFGKGGSMIDLGAQWISGENEVFHLMKDHFEFGDTGVNEENQTFLTTFDEKIDTEKLGKLQALGSSIMYENADLKEEMKASKESFGEFAKMKYFQALQQSEYEGIDRELANMYLRHGELQEFNILNATETWNDFPARSFAQIAFVEGNQMMTWKKSGYKTLLDFMIKRLREKTNVNLEEKILFNKKVVNINWTTDNIWIKCEDETEYRCDHVISTIPLGVMRANHQTLFTPQLSDEKIEAIKSFGSGTLGKIFLEFKERVFQNDERSMVFLWSESDLTEIHGTDKEWLIQIHGFMHVDEQPNMIEGLLAGNFMREFEMFEDAKIINDCIWLLEKFLKKHLDRPINVRRNRWLTKDNFLGAYAHPSLQTKDDSADNLRKSICDDHGKPAIIFSGEATSKEHQGYVHGAVEEGWRAAQELIDFYRF